MGERGGVVDSLKEQGSIEKKAQRQKDRLDADLQQAQKDMMSVRMKSTFITGILMVSVFTFVGTMYADTLVPPVVRLAMF